MDAYAGGAALHVANLSKTFGEVIVLDHVSLTIGTGEVHALAGANGSGKSTFIKVLSGYHRPDAGGRVEVAGKALDLGSAEASYAAGLRFVHQDLGLVDAMNIEDNLFLNRGYATTFGTIRSKANRAAARAVLDSVGLDLDPMTLVADLTPATKTAVAVARALQGDDNARAQVLVLDEPTATLPSDDVERLLELVERVARTGVGVLYVTHRLGEIFRVADRVTVLRDGRRVASEPVAAVTRDQIVHQMVGAELDEAAALSRDARSDGEVVLATRDLATDRVYGLDLEVREGEVLGIAGITGSGREAVLGSLFGAVDRSGVVTVAGAEIPPLQPRAAIRHRVGFVPADRKRSGGLMEATARENLSLVDVGSLRSGPRIDRAAERREARRWFVELDVRPPGRIELPLKSFSGGNQQKIILAKWLRCEPRVLLLDEPTQGVDVAAKGIIHHQIRETAGNGAGVVVSSSDVDELVALCDRVVVMRDGRAAVVLEREELSVQRLSRECVATGEPQSATASQATSRAGDHVKTHEVQDQ